MRPSPPCQEARHQAGLRLSLQRGGRGAGGGRIGHASVKSGARVSRSAVMFVEKIEQVKLLVETGLTVNGIFIFMNISKIFINAQTRREWRHFCKTYFLYVKRNLTGSVCLIDRAVC